MKNKFPFLFFLLSINSYAQFPPSAGKPGSSAIYKDSAVFVSWATGCNVTRGFMDISNPSLGLVTSGDSSLALGKAGENGVVSLGDGGIAILTFNPPIKNGSGWDFAIFENSFSDEFLELAFVEVSSDGINFFRFPATSLTQDTLQVGTFGLLNAEKINNLAGKYRAIYGTPFELEELTSRAGLDVNHITHIKIIDAVGSISENFCTFDQYGHKINDPWPTPFESGGFDLDAVGVIHQINASVVEDKNFENDINIFPNPVNANSVLMFYSSDNNSEGYIYDVLGNEIDSFNKTKRINNDLYLRMGDFNLTNGVYYVCFTTKNGYDFRKIIYLK